MPTLPLSHPSNRRERRSIELRERIFRAALDLFAKQGFAETTVEDITDAADVGKGTFFNYFPSKDHILLAFAEMQLAKLRLAVDDARRTAQPMPQFMRSLAALMTQEPVRNPDIIRLLLLAFLSNSQVREAMLDLQARVLAFHTEMIQLGQERGEIRADLPAADIALVFRQTIFGTLLIWSLYGDSSLQARMDSAFEIIWSGLSPRAPSNLSSSDAVPPVSR
ncbi:MAG TPA: TetR/AcrR family transcriptional regulator [Verrucomicrobiae bacterium]|nr:TetR/AcrR family transcriptional regulator [Verrucomicrobiae bacterium]